MTLATLQVTVKIMISKYGPYLLTWSHNVDGPGEILSPPHRNTKNAISAQRIVFVEAASCQRGDQASEAFLEAPTRCKSSGLFSG